MVGVEDLLWGVSTDSTKAILGREHLAIEGRCDTGVSLASLVIRYPATDRISSYALVIFAVVFAVPFRVRLAPCRHFCD